MCGSRIFAIVQLIGGEHIAPDWIKLIQPQILTEPDDFTIHVYPKDKDVDGVDGDNTDIVYNVQVKISSVEYTATEIVPLFVDFAVTVTANCIPNPAIKAPVD